MNEITVDIDYQPNAKQELFHESEATEVIYGGAKGGGKSCALSMEALAYGMDNPGCKVYLFRETYDDLEANLISEMKEKWPKQLYTYNDSKHIATLYNGSRIFYRYIRNKQDAEGYQGRSMDFIGVDELTKHDEDWIQILLSCLRSPKGFPVKFVGTCNPGGRGHGWVKEKYIERTEYGEKMTVCEISGNTQQFIPAKVYDNVVLMDNDPGYVKRLENLPEDERKAFLHGDWDIFAGQYFTTFRRNKHVIEPFELPDHWRRYRSIDWGFNDHCAVYWHCTDSDGHTYTYRELYIRETLASDVAKEIVRLSEGEKIEYTVASVDMWQKRGIAVRNKAGEMVGQSIAEDFLLNGVPLVQADNARVIGWSRMNEELADSPDGEPWWMIFSNCKNLIRTLPLMIRDDKKVEDVADKLEDHACESVRYYFMSRPARSKDKEKPKTLIQKHKDKLKKQAKAQTQRVM